MAVRLDINANVRGATQVNRLNRAVGTLGVRAQRSAAAMASLEVAATRGRASLALLATTLNVAVIGALAGVTFGLSRFIKATFETGDLIEGLGIRFELLFGSVEEGGRAFEALADFAARVPFSLADIAAGSGNLAVVSKDADDLANILEITGNVAAATGLDFRQTAEQIQRAFAGGIAAADVFRERGVRAMLGFQSGVTVSIEETVQRFEEVFSGNGRFARATGLLAETLQGQLSLVDDAFFSFRRTVADTFFSQLTGQVRGIVEDIATNSEQITRIAQRIGTGLGTAFLNLEKIARSLIDNFQLIISSIKALIAFKITGVILGITAAFAQWTIGIISASLQFGILNAIMRANPIGILITAIQLAATAFIFFEKEIREGLAVALEYLNTIFTRVSDRVIKLVRLLNVLPGVNIMIMTSQERINAALAEGEKSAVRFGIATRDAAKAFTIVDGEAKLLEETLNRLNIEGGLSAAGGATANIINTSADIIEASINRANAAAGLGISVIINKAAETAGQAVLDAGGTLAEASAATQAVLAKGIENAAQEAAAIVIAAGGTLAAAQAASQAALTKGLEDAGLAVSKAVLEIGGSLKEAQEASEAIGNVLVGGFENAANQANIIKDSLESIDFNTIAENAGRAVLSAGGSISEAQAAAGAILGQNIQAAADRAAAVILAAGGTVAEAQLESEAILAEGLENAAAKAAEAVLIIGGSLEEARAASESIANVLAESFEEAADEAKTLKEAVESLGLTSSIIGNTISDQWIEGWKEGATVLERLQNIGKSLLNTVVETIVRNTINLGIEKLFEQLGQKKIDNEKMLNNEKQKGFLISKAEAAIQVVTGLATTFLGFQQGGIVPNTPGSTPGRDSVPALLTPGERVIPKSAVDNGEGATYVTNITQNLSTRNLNDALIEAIRTQAEDVNAILEAERNNN